MSLAFGSVCSGIEAASCAWHPLGWRTQFVSEIETFFNFARCITHLSASKRGRNCLMLRPPKKRLAGCATNARANVQFNARLDGNLLLTAKEPAMTIPDPFNAAWASREWGLWGIDDEACARYWFEKGYREALKRAEFFWPTDDKHGLAAFKRAFVCIDTERE